MSTDHPTSTKRIEYGSQCKSGCGYLSTTISFVEKGEDHSGDRWIRCTECGKINRAFDET